jgi:hypothetical protein
MTEERMKHPMAACEEAFETASRNAPEYERDLWIAGRPVTLQIAGDLLARTLIRPWAHVLRTTPEQPALTIRCWDERATGVPLPDEAERFFLGTSDERYAPVLRYTSDERIAAQATPGLLVLLDRATGTMVVWCKDVREIPVEERHRPFHLVLRTWIRDRGALFVHAGTVANAGEGVLIGGPQGAGKSTTALMCISAGWQFLGDDYAAVEALPDGSVTGYSTYGSGHLHPAHLDRFSSLAGYGARELLHNGKRAVFLHEVFPERLIRATALKAIVLPRIAGERLTSLSVATPAETIARLLPSTLLPDTRELPVGFPRFVEIVARLRRYWLNLGEDLEAIPDAVGEALRR